MPYKDKAKLKEYLQRPDVMARHREHSKERYHRPEVKEQIKNYHKEYYQRPDVKERIKEYRNKPEVISKKRESDKKYSQRPEIKQKKVDYDKEYYKNNKELILIKGKEYREKPEVNQKITERSAKYRKENKEIINARNFNYRHNPLNKSRYNEYHKEYQTNRTKNDSFFKLIRLMRNRTYTLIKAYKMTKSKRTMELLSAPSRETVLNHLQDTAINNGYLDFDINNYDSNKYHIDHIIPVDSFDLTKEEEQRKAFHYTNLQILLAKVNIKKSNKLNIDLKSIKED